MPEDQINSTDNPEEILDDSPSEQSESDKARSQYAAELIRAKREKPKSNLLPKLITGFAASILLFITLCAASLCAMYALNPDAVYELLGSAVSEFVSPDSPRDSQSQSPNN